LVGKDLIKIHGHALSDLSGEYVAKAKRRALSFLKYPLCLKLIFKPSEEVKARAIEYKDLGLSKSIAPNTGIEGHIFFQVPIEENPRELYFEVGIIGPTQAKITL